MRVMSRSVVLGAAALAALLAVGTTASASLSVCASAKKKCVDKKVGALLKCYIASEKTGLPVVQECLTKAKGKYDGGTKGFDGSCFGKAEHKYDVCVGGTNDGETCENNTVCPGGSCTQGCPTDGDIQNLEDKADAFVLDIIRELDPQFPALGIDLCGVAKKKAVAKKVAGLLKCHEKSEKDGITPLEPCLSTARGKFKTADPLKSPFKKAELKYPLGAPPPDCQTYGDIDAIEDKVDAFVADVVCELHPADCPVHRPTRITFEGTSTDGVLDAGWNGLGHDAQVISDGLVTVLVTGCANAMSPYGVCSYVGPTSNMNRDNGVLNNQRCANDSTKRCNADSDCTASTCEYWFGSYLPLSAGGVTTCIGNYFSGGISGTANVDTGDSDGSADLTSVVYSGAPADKPCPHCLGDGPTPNDGQKNGMCDSGLANGDDCDVNGSSPSSIFGKTSLDCPPETLSLAGVLGINLDNTTGTKTKTLDANSPNCRAVGYTTRKCQCDTCNSLAAEPCSANADCTDGPDAPGAPLTGAVCGGKRCNHLSGVALEGKACTQNSQCSPGSCDVPGEATQPNKCTGGPDNCVADTGNERVCSGGPFDCFCDNAHFQSCTSPSDPANCGPWGSNSCTFCKNRDCFDDGLVNSAVNSSGDPDVPIAHQSDPALGSLFCIAPTANLQVNGAAGLPSLGRLELRGHATENGVP